MEPKWEPDGTLNRPGDLFGGFREGLQKKTENRDPNGAPMGPKMGPTWDPKSIKKRVRDQSCSQEGSRGAFGEVLGAPGDHFGRHF